MRHLRWLRRVDHRVGRRVDQDSGMALLMTITCIVVSLTLVTALLGVLRSELTPTAYERRTARSMAAAEAGLQAELGVIRSAVSVNPQTGLGGDATLLPCQWPAVMNGTVGGTPGNPAYAVTVRYFVADPSNQNAVWRLANALSCTSGSGPAQVPSYALLESTATSDATNHLAATEGDRSQEFVYTFNRTDAGVLGGLVRSGQYSTAGTNCWQAPSVPPNAGDPVTLAACDSTDLRQLWSYRPDYSLVLSATQGSATPSTGGWCVSGDQVGWNSPIDGSGNGNDAIPSGGYIWGAVGPVSGSGVALNGTDGYLRTARSATAPAATTVSVWFKTSTGGGYLFQYGSAADLTSTTYDRMLWLNPAGALVWGVWTGSANTLVSPGSYADGVWHLASASVGSAGMALYVDGAKVASAAAPTTGQSYSGYWHLGAGAVNSGAWPNQPASGYFSGSLAHAASWSGQLTDSQVNGLYAQTTYSSYQGAVLGLGPAAYWALGGSNASVVATLQACDGREHQRWSYNDNGRFELERFDATSLSGVCLHAADVVGATVSVQGCSGARDWAPAATVGAGAAGTATMQLVNFAEYGRCLDVTNWDVNYPWLIDYPCKQDPTHPVGGNQRWTYGSVTHQLSANFGGNPCLTAPATPGGRVLTVTCSGSSTAQTWTVNQDTGVRSTSYTIVDSFGRCLSLGQPGTTSGGLAQWSSIISETCDGTYKQKWNAPAQFAAAGVFAERETTNGK